MKSFILRIVIIIFSTSLLSSNFFAQSSGGVTNQKVGYRDFDSPLKGKILLAGNFGENRPDHFHCGIDMKTDGKENYPVYTAMEGYVSRIKMEPGGFGHALYINHPNGYTTVYAHLNDFVPKLQEYMVQQQYAQKKWRVDINLTPEQFPLQRGEQIAWSGNTGGSTAPHLHFEIRKTDTEKPQNPQLFSFKINDNIPPKPFKIMIYEGEQSIYLQQAKVLNLINEDGFYKSNQDTIWLNGKTAGIGIAVYDYMEESNNTLAYYKMSWFANKQLQGTITLDDIGYEEVRYVNAYADLCHKEKFGDWPVLLFQQRGNQLHHIYQDLNENNGLIDLSTPKEVSVNIADAYGNISVVRITLASKNLKTNHHCNNVLDHHLIKQTPYWKVEIPTGSFYDATCFNHQYTNNHHKISGTLKLLGKEIHGHYPSTVGLKANKAIPFHLRQKIVIIRNDGQKNNGQAAEFADGYFTSRFRKFGEFHLAIDTLPPSVSFQHKSNVFKTGDIIKFLVKENITTVTKFDVTVGKQWLCFEQKGNEWHYKVDKYCPKGLQQFTITTTDENNNSRTVTHKINIL